MSHHVSIYLSVYEDARKEELKDYEYQAEGGNTEEQNPSFVGLDDQRGDKG